MRADLFLVNGGYAASRNRAQRLIEARAVRIDGAVVRKVSEQIDEAENHIVEISHVENEKFVSRGGLKLESALDAFDVDVSGKIAIDIGASTGGFTDCLLSRGALLCVAIDSGSGQLDPKLACDERVKNIEKYNARELSRDIIPDGADIAVMDVSFISQTLIHEGVSRVLKENGVFISLIKPQFEAGRSAVGKGGIVKNENDRFLSVLKVRDSAAGYGLFMTGLIRSPITGGDGNLEYLAIFMRHAQMLSELDIKKGMR